MAKMISPAGDMDINIQGVGREGNKFTVTAQMGIWDSTMYLEPGEVFNMLKLMMRPSVLGYLFMLPFIYLAEKRRKK